MLLRKQMCLTPKNSSVTTTVFFHQGVVDDQKIIAFSSQSISDLFKSGLSNGNHYNNKPIASLCSLQCHVADAAVQHWNRVTGSGGAVSGD